MRELTPDTALAFTEWLSHAPRPHTGALRAATLEIEGTWQVNLRTDGRLLHDTWQAHGDGRLLWTHEGIVADLIRHSKTGGWEWVRSATTAWRILHSSKGPDAPPSIKEALTAVLQDQGAARFALDTTRLEAILASSTARGIHVDTATLNATKSEMLHTHKLLRELMGFDPLPDANDAATLAWLTKHGVHVDATSGDAWGRRTTDRSALACEAEAVYEEALHLRRRLPKVFELSRELRRGKVHTKLTPAAQVSGRISSTGPALNNVAKDLRHLLVARPGHVLVTADFDGIEPRVLAALSGDSKLIADLESGDPYADAAERAGYCRISYRNAFKIVMISTMYGAQAGRTARQLGVSLAEAERVRKLLWAPYPLAKAWLQAQTGLGTHRLDSGRPLGVIDSEHARPNLIIQSTAYDIFQDAALRVHDHLPAGSHIWMPIHDEVVIETPTQNADAVLKVLASQMPSNVRGVRISAKPVMLGSTWRKA
ncbi:DNA polymerase [Microbacterium sp. RU33B]|uniref:DNA polymerase n=1 Tax=Microbacterium sp. RU33B TaxID=1907390 RepID=UPI000969BD05|nr:DNA polymerase [Microbacterium sp. RU33B]SIT72594.1 DNA polymerase family A [Microbacterium sp. RU33B]